MHNYLTHHTHTNTVIHLNNVSMFIAYENKKFQAKLFDSSLIFVLELLTLTFISGKIGKFTGIIKFSLYFVGKECTI